jgi:cell division transport system permease protein
MHVFHWREAWRLFRAHRGLALTSIASLTAALTLCGVFLLLDHNVRQFMHQMGDRRELIVYLKDTVSEGELTALTDKMRQYFGEPTYVSRKQAWEEFSEQIADPELLAGVEDNPLPASLHVRLKPELLNLSAMEQAARQVREFDEVEDVRYGAEYVGRFDQLSSGLRLATLAVGLLVIGALILVLYNTLRLTVLARRAQVEIMLRMGASDRFIATPYVFEAMLQVGIAAIGALLLTFALQQGVATNLVGLRFLPWTSVLGFLVCAMLVAWAASAAALTRILRTIGA